VESARASYSEEYKGHVLQLLIEILPTESIGHMVQKALTECYLPGSIVPTPDTLHYTLGKHPSNLVWTQDRRPFYDIQLNALTRREIMDLMSTRNRVMDLMSTRNRLMDLMSTRNRLNMDLMSTRNRLMSHKDDLGPQKTGLPLTLSLRILQQSTQREKCQ